MPYTVIPTYSPDILILEPNVFGDSSSQGQLIMKLHCRQGQDLASH
jgi:hypothetical protein